MAHDFKKFPELTNRQMTIYYFDSPHRQITDGFIAKVTRVVDGDTIRVMCDFRDFEFPIRFLNSMAPELKEKGGRESKAWLEDQILGEEIYVQVKLDNRVGRWGRLLGIIFHRGFDINEESIRQGHAVAMSESAHTAPLKEDIFNFFKRLEKIKI